MKSRIRTGQYDFPNPEWQSVSEQAKELIKGMLNVDPGIRLTIDDIMKNTWISVMKPKPHALILQTLYIN